MVTVNSVRQISCPRNRSQTASMAGAGSRGWASKWSFIVVASLQAAHVFEAVLLEDGGEVGLGHVVGEGAVAEDDGGVAGRGQLLVPGHDAQCQRLDFVAVI